jgi:hypothetical protein
MNAAETLAAVREAGISLRPAPDGASIIASPSSRLTDPLRAAIRANKPLLITALAKPVCAVCGADGDLWHIGDSLIHQECARFLRKPADEPTAAYQATSVQPDGSGCKVEIVELPQAQRYRKVFGFLQLKPPVLVEVERWRQCVQDGSKFLAVWGEQAEALGWTSADLFGLHTPPEQPHPSYNRLSRYDATGLCWLLQDRPVVALTAATAAIENDSGSITVYRKHNKPALGPVGDSLGVE